MRWIKRKWAVAKQNPLFWANILLTGIVCLVLRYEAPMAPFADLHLRILGAFLELVGVGTVWYDLSRSAAKVGKDGILRRTMKWLGVLVLNRPIVVSATASFSSSHAMALRASQLHAMNPEASVDERLHALEQNMRAFDSQLAASWKKIDAVSDDLRKGLATERDARETQFKDVSNRLTDIAAGSYALLLFGVVWLCVGLLISGFSQEFIRYL
jgi:hypothetical protein